MEIREHRKKEKEMKLQRKIDLENHLKGKAGETNKNDKEFKSYQK